MREKSVGTMLLIEQQVAADIRALTAPVKPPDRGAPVSTAVGPKACEITITPTMEGPAVLNWVTEIPGVGRDVHANLHRAVAHVSSALAQERIRLFSGRLAE